MKRVIVVALLLSGLLCAQTPKPNQPSTSASSAVTSAPPANAPSRESVLRMLDTLHVKRTMNIMFDGMTQSMKQGARQGFLKEKPDATDEQLKMVDSLFDDSFKDFNIDDLIELIVVVYQRHFSQADVDGLTAFYQGPIGQKYLAEQPAMMQETMKASQDYATKQMGPGLERMQEKMKRLVDSINKEAEEKSKATTDKVTPKKP